MKDNNKKTGGTRTRKNKQERQKKIIKLKNEKLSQREKNIEYKTRKERKGQQNRIRKAKIKEKASCGRFMKGGER